MTYTYTCKDCNAESEFHYTPRRPGLTEGPAQCLCGEPIHVDDVNGEIEELAGEACEGVNEYTGPDTNEECCGKGGCC